MTYEELVDELTAYDPDRWIGEYEGTLRYSTYCNTIYGKKPIILLEIVNVHNSVITLNFAKGDLPDTIRVTNTTFSNTDDTVVQELDTFAAELSRELLPLIEKMLANYYDNIERLKTAGFSSNYDSNVDLYQSQYILRLDSRNLFVIDLESPECLLVNEDEVIDALEMFDLCYSDDSTNLSSIYASITPDYENGIIRWSAETDGSVADIFEQLEGV